MRNGGQVTASQVMVQERKRRTNGEGMEPKRDFGEFDRHGILVDAVDDALEHHAPYDVAIVELRLDDGPFVRFGRTQNFRSDLGDEVAPFI
jgi:hypothetical protein